MERIGERGNWQHVADRPCSITHCLTMFTVAGFDDPPTDGGGMAQ
jgi:hypothetical protein